MKYIKKILFVSVLYLSLTSCEHLLDIDPVNSMVPTTVSDFEQVLLSGYIDSEFFMRTELSTDNVELNFNSSSELSDDYSLWFTWAESHQADGEIEDRIWGELYRSIYNANSVIDELDLLEVLPEEEELLEIVKGEAHAVRALAYFYLANFYAEPYSKEKESMVCVPLITTANNLTTRIQNNTRESIGVIWKLIVSDLELSSNLLFGKPFESKFRFNYYSVEALKSRVHLFMGEYDKAISSADAVIDKYKLWDMNKMPEYAENKEETIGSLINYKNGFINTDYNKEILFYWCSNGGSAGARANIFYYSEAIQKPSDELIDSYYMLKDASNPESDTILDYRKYIYLVNVDKTDPKWKEKGTKTYKMYASQGDNVTAYIGLKLGEVILNRAEAYARKGLKTEALDDVKLLMKNRILDADFPVYEDLINAEEDVLGRVLLERRKETAFDGGLRWLDIRRLVDRRTELVHTDKEQNKYVLKVDDPRYVLQIPRSEQKFSPNMELNPR
ncbi:RagB/SusD family nutrient uptake outer membrane protein [Ancylomarina salipaludis]|uniref:RagB/SusD family nutrient uptake outer membrane protein n=1 Tax=Ancylomarina salipaludis TaxID=2501299 RepID=A0A4V1MZW7_9BACT|nr:RagB/SusD family nutrient uptake outer membrane protein [Ancylomarina salipaludis]RXQ90959.1 RagB/SusD family nutrient uptake outer membrane protein [Ancylomarina salipaludis]